MLKYIVNYIVNLHQRSFSQMCLPADIYQSPKCFCGTGRETINYLAHPFIAGPFFCLLKLTGES